MSAAVQPEWPVNPGPRIHRALTIADVVEEHELWRRLLELTPDTPAFRAVFHQIRLLYMRRGYRRLLCANDRAKRLSLKRAIGSAEARWRRRQIRRQERRCRDAADEAAGTD